jgi:hypothetical protein
VTKIAWPNKLSNWIPPARQKCRLKKQWIPAAEQATKLRNLGSKEWEN